jgi:hypothetical protein
LVINIRWLWTGKESMSRSKSRYWRHSVSLSSDIEEEYDSSYSGCISHRNYNNGGVIYEVEGNVIFSIAKSRRDFE